MRAQGHWREGTPTPAEPIPNDNGTVAISEKAKGYWIDGEPGGNTVKDIKISRSEAMANLNAMDSTLSRGEFTLQDGRRYQITDGKVVRVNKGSLATRIKEGVVKIAQGYKPLSDAQLFTAALQKEVGLSPTSENIINSWDGKNFTEPLSVVTEMGARGNQSNCSFQFLVHAAPISHLVNGLGIFSVNAESSIRSWDVICASIINQSQTYTYRSVGVILKVPKQNIVAASPDDLMSETNIGLKERSDFLVNASDEEIASSKSMPSYQRTGLLKRELARHQRHMNTPQKVLDNTYKARNEIILITKEGINFHSGHQATGKVEISALFINDSELTVAHKDIALYCEKELLSKDERCDLFDMYAIPLAKKMGIPVIYLNGNVDLAEFIDTDLKSCSE